MHSTHIKRTKQSNIGKTAKTHHNINMFTTGNTHLKYRKQHVHSAAHKLKIRSSRLVVVLTTAGTDLDSTDRAVMWGAKNSSASEPLKRPILSLWNSRDIGEYISLELFDFVNRTSNCSLITFRTTVKQ